MFQKLRDLISQLAGIAGPDEPECLVCLCHPAVTFCGKYNPPESLGDPGDVDGSECQQCLDVEAISGCPNCGCRWSKPCKTCGQKVSHEQ